MIRGAGRGARALTFDASEVLAAADLFARADRDLAKEMRRVIAREVNPWLQSAIRRNGRTEQDRRIASSARIRSGSNPAVVVPGGRFSGGASARTADIVRVYEFGGRREYIGRYLGRSPRGRAYPVRRKTQRQIPDPNRQGRMIYAAVADAAPMLVGAWVGVIMDTYEGRT